MVRRLSASELRRSIPVHQVFDAPIVRRPRGSPLATRRPGGQTGVQQFGVPAPADLDVRRSDVEMQHALGVCGADRLGKLDAEVEGPADIERAPSLQLIEGLPRHELEHEEQLRRAVGDLEQRGDVRVRDRGGGARVPQEPGPRKRVRSHPFGGVLDEHGSADHGVAGSERRAESAGADPFEEVVVTELIWHR